MSIDRAEIFNSLDPGSSGSNGNHNLPNGSLKLIETNQQKEQKLIRLVYKNLITWQNNQAKRLRTYPQ